MEKVFHFDTPRAHYVADAAIVWCFDSRFHAGFSKFLQKKLNVLHSDVVKLAGGAKCLATPEQEKERGFVLSQLASSIALHQTRRIILMLHSDCGAYGGLAAFSGDAAKEAAHHEAALRRAAAAVTEAFPAVPVEAYFIDFEGVWKVDLAAGGRPVAG